MSQSLIAAQSEFEELCDHIRESGLVAFDTEFVSEYTYQPELCLLQFATQDRCAAADPFQISDLSSWWDIMADDTTTVAVHGGQAEVRFCLNQHGPPPRKLVDIQLAEGLQSRSYPLSYSALVSRVLDKNISGKETRTDWRRRPLTDDQIRYAMEDVRHVLEIWEQQRKSLENQERLDWAEVEFERFVTDLVSDSQREPWERLSGVHKLSRRDLAVLRELAAWREQEASERNRPVRKIIRDDLLIEMSRRHPKTTAELLATRDMNRGDYKRAAPKMLQCIQRGMGVPRDELPKLKKNLQNRSYDDHVLGKLLAIALANRCAQMNVAMSLVGTSADLRELVRWHIESRSKDKTPRLAEGWRSDVCGQLLEDLLDGKITLRVADPHSDYPLVFEEFKDSSN